MSWMKWRITSGGKKALMWTSKEYPHSMSPSAFCSLRNLFAMSHIEVAATRPAIKKSTTTTYRMKNIVWENPKLKIKTNPSDVTKKTI